METELFHRDEEAGIFQVLKTKGVGFYNYSHDTKEIPLQSHPIYCKRVGEAFWTHRKLSLLKEILEQPQAPPGHMIYNNPLESEDYIDVGKVASDGLVHLVQQTVAIAWIVASGTEYCMSACYLMANKYQISLSKLPNKYYGRTMKRSFYFRGGRAMAVAIRQL